MAEGFGLGAVAYFRRVIEDKGTELVDRLKRIAEAEGDAERAAQLEAAKASPHVSDRLKAAVAAVPPSMRPGNMNPLGVLYGAFSEELHAGESDEKALDTAQTLHRALDILMRRLVEYDEETAELKALQRFK